MRSIPPDLRIHLRNSSFDRDSHQVYDYWFKFWRHWIRARNKIGLRSLNSIAHVVGLLVPKFASRCKYNRPYCIVVKREKTSIRPEIILQQWDKPLGLHSKYLHCNLSSALVLGLVHNPYSCNSSTLKWEVKSCQSPTSSFYKNTMYSVVPLQCWTNDWLNQLTSSWNNY